MTGLILVGCVVAIATIHSVTKSYEIPRREEIRNIDNINRSLSTSHQRAINRSRKSSVRVMSVSPSLGGVSTSSGTYISFRGEYYILTVAHGLIGGCEGTAVVTPKGTYHCKYIVERNNLIDYSILAVDPIPELKAIPVPQFLPRGDQWKKDFSIMTPTYYTGFPNGMGPFTIDGKVVGYNENDFLYIKSYGWAGCSGAGVFSESGHLVAYILALTVGQTEYGYNVAEDIVIGVPLFKVNWLSIIENKKQETRKDEEKEQSTESGLPDSSSTDSGVGSTD